MKRDASGETPRDERGLATLRTSLERRFRTTTSEVEIAGERYELLHPVSAEDLINADDFDEDERLPYWADVWPSSHVLGARLRAMEGLGRPLLELGCGAGLVSACAARAGFNVTATDYYDDALRFTAVNVWRNAGVALETRHVDWRDLPPGLGGYEIVVASDVLYERPYARLVAGVIDATLAPRGLALVADPGRVAAPEFLEAARELGFQVTLAARVAWEQGAIRQHIDIHALTRP